MSRACWTFVYCPDNKAKKSNTEHGWKEYEIKYRQMQEMFARLKKLGININFKVASGYAGKKIEPLPSTLRKRRPTPGDF